MDRVHYSVQYATHFATLWLNWTDQFLVGGQVLIAHRYKQARDVDSMRQKAIVVSCGYGACSQRLRPAGTGAKGRIDRRVTISLIPSSYSVVGGNWRAEAIVSKDPTYKQVRSNSEVIN
jgi:hypothetical protein